MELNYQLPVRAVGDWQSFIADRNLGEIASAVEDAGFDIISTTDHPFPDHRWVSNGGHHAFDPFVALAFMAAATERLRLLTFIVVAGYRNPYLTAKSAASLDLLSGGRLILGMGAGYQRAEFDVLGASFADRGRRFDAALDAMRMAWTGAVVDHDDATFPARGHQMLPRPLQTPGPPVWVGGNSAAAMGRVARAADGWLPFEQAAPAAAVTGTAVLAADELAERIAELRRMRRDLGRPETFDVCFTPRLDRDPQRAAETLAADMAAYLKAGVTCLSIESRARDVQGCLSELDIYARALTRR